jgi:acetylornithine deacetylase
MSKRPTAETLDLLARLVAFDTTSHKSNMALVRFVVDDLARQGVEAALVPTPDGEKASLFATVGPQGIPGIGLSGHTDVVPADARAWTGDPFTVRASAGRLYGRGTADMKGFLACVLAMVPEFKRRRLKVPIHLLFSYDEEIGCTGVRPMIAELGRRFAKPRAVIVGEPTSMAVVDAHKGPVRWQIEITGRAAHSSMPQLGANAIAAAAALIGEASRIERELAHTHAPRFTPPYPTLQVTEIAGGVASNVVPASCRFGFEIRALPGLDIDAIEARLAAFARNECLPALRRVAPEADIVLRQTNRVPPFEAERMSEVVALALKLAGQNDTEAVSYATEAGLFQAAGVPAVVCGPGDIAQAHTADEWIASSEIDRCLAFLDRLADWCET